MTQQNRIRIHDPIKIIRFILVGDYAVGGGCVNAHFVH